MPTNCVYAMSSSETAWHSAARSRCRSSTTIFPSIAVTADVIVADTVILEIESVERLLPLHEAQLLTYLRIGRYSVGLLMNFNTVPLKHGLRRCVM